MPRLAAVALLLAGCSLALDFDDECATDDDCAASERCDAKFCVPADSAPPATLLTTFCPTLYPPDVTEAQVAAGEVVLIGSLQPNSGDNGAKGASRERAIFLAVDEIDQAGGIGGKKLAVLACDDGTKGQTAIDSATHLATVARVPAIVGPAGSTAVTDVYTQVTRDHHVLLISPSATASTLTDLDNGLIWRTAPPDTLQGAAIAAWLGAGAFDKVAVVNADTAYGNALAQVIEGEFCPEAACADPAHYQRRIYSPDATRLSDQSAAIADLQTFQPDVIVLIGLQEDGVAFLQSATQTDAAHLGRYVLTDGLKSATLLDAGLPDAVVSGLFGTAPATPDNHNYATFAVSYSAKYRGAQPEVYNAQAYDATYLLAFALAAIGPQATVTGEAIDAQLQRLSRGTLIVPGPRTFAEGVNVLRSAPGATIDYDGASGPLDFDPQTGEAPADIAWWRLDAAAKAVVEVDTLYTADGVYQPPAEAPASLPPPASAPPAGM